MSVQLAAMLYACIAPRALAIANTGQLPVSTVSRPNNSSAVFARPIAILMKMRLKQRENYDSATVQLPIKSERHATYCNNERRAK